MTTTTNRPLCINCVNFNMSPAMKHAECTSPAPQRIDLVYGHQNRICQSLREEGGACGPNAVHFSAHPAPIDQPGNAEAIACPASSIAEPIVRDDSPAVRTASASSSNAGATR